MKKKISYLVVMALAVMILASCGVVRGVGEGLGVVKRPLDEITSETEVGLILLEQYIEYTIDISNADGRLILNKMTEEEAKEYITSAALIKYGCDVIFRPKYNVLKKGKQILRITMGGRPANYQNKGSQIVPVPSGSSQSNKTNININVNN